MRPAVHDRQAKITLPTDDQILIERAFAAPRHLVYRAFTEPELVKRWWHARRGTVTVVEIDLRSGGAWRYVMVTDDGTQIGFHGEYHEIVPDERIVSTEVFEGHPESGVQPSPGSRNTTTFTELEDATKLTILIQATSRAVRDAIIASGMEAGLQDAFDLAEQVAQSIHHPN